MTATGSSGFVAGGNAFASNTNIGLTDAYNLGVLTSGTVRMTVTAAGNVGIGTTAPTGRLTIQQALDTAAGGFRVISTAGTGSTAFYLDASNRTHIGGATSSTDAIVIINNSGVVGMGTSQPQAALDIFTTGTMSAIIIPRDTTANRNAAPSQRNASLQLQTPRKFRSL